MKNQSDSRGRALTVLIANPSPDVYGSDLQMVQSVRALREQGIRVIVVLPEDGPLVPQLTAAGATVEFVSFPVLRRANDSIAGLARLIFAVILAIPRLCVYVRRTAPEVLYVNTVTLPWWLLVGRLMGIPSICHLHEAETQDRRFVRVALTVPLRFSSAVIVISQAAMRAMCDVVPSLAETAHLIYNGVPQPPTQPHPAVKATRTRLLVVGRLSPRKAPHLALAVTAELLGRGLDVELEVAGTCFAGYEWYESQLRERATEADLAGRVTFSGYCSPVWPAFARNAIVVAPSLREPFGNAVVEAQMALRPVVASAAMGHQESITHGKTGLLVPAADIIAMANAVENLIADASLRDSIVTSAAESALERFSVDRYRRQVVSLVYDLAEGGLPRSSLRVPLRSVASSSRPPEPSRKRV